MKKTILILLFLFATTQVFAANCTLILRGFSEGMRNAPVEKQLTKAECAWSLSTMKFDSVQGGDDKSQTVVAYCTCNQKTIAQLKADKILDDYLKKKAKNENN
jgi:hypothetical protein